MKLEKVEVSWEPKHGRYRVQFNFGAHRAYVYFKQHHTPLQVSWTLKEAAEDFAIFDED